MPRVEAARELLAPREDVWAFLAEPRHLSDWWPGLAAVRPDRRGFARGERWEVHCVNRPRLFRTPSPWGLVLVPAVEPLEWMECPCVRARIDVALRPPPTPPHRTSARLTA